MTFHDFLISIVVFLVVATTYLTGVRPLLFASDLGSSEPRVSHLFLNSGLYFINSVRISQIPSGIVFSNPFANVGIDFSTKMGESLPRVGFGFQFSPISQKSPEGGTSSRLYLVSLQIEGEFYPNSLFFLVGPSFKILKISGRGGTTIQKNGLSEKSFSLPEDSVSAQNVLLQFSIGAQFYQFNKLRLLLSTFTSRMLSSRRTIDLSINASYAIF